MGSRIPWGARVLGSPPGPVDRWMKPFPSKGKLYNSVGFNREFCSLTLSFTLHIFVIITVFWRVVRSGAHRYNMLRAWFLLSITG